MDGHINLEKFPDSCRLLQNMLALKQGPITRRGGTMFIKEVKDSADDTALIPFEFNVTQSYQIEAGDQYLRFYTSNAAIVESANIITNATQANPVVITSTAHGYSNGDEVFISGVNGMTELNGKYYLVANQTANTFELTDIDGNNVDGTGFSSYTSAGTAQRVYEIASPYATADLFDSDGLPSFQYAQSADVLYVVHGSYEPRSINRTSDTSWTVNTMILNDGPFLPINDTDTTLTLSGTTGSVTVTASATTGINDGDGFQTTDVGRLIRWKDPANNWTWLKITARASTTSVTATISGDDASATTATTSWRLGVYSDTTGWPTVITFFQNRVLLAGASSYPDRYDLTITGGYSDTTFFFAPSDADGTVTDDAGITGTLQSGKVNTIQWAGSDDKGLILGTAGREWIVRPSTTGNVLTPDNQKADPFSSIGSAYIQPIQAENGTVFIQRARRRMHDIIYSFERDQLKPRDLNIASEHITRSGVAEIKFQQEPINNIWMRLTNGKLIGFTYYPDEAVFAASSHPLGGTDAKVKSISVIPSSDGSRDELSLIVERTVNGTTRKYVEYMTRYYEDDLLKREAVQVDSALTLDAPVTITGATQANPVVVTAASHRFSNGDFVDIEDVVGMTELNNIRYKIKNRTANTFELTDTDDVNIDGLAFTAYASGGEVRKAVDSVSGLDHLEGETVKVMRDGKSHPDVTVSSGAIILLNDTRGSVIQVGLGNTWAFRSQRIEAGARDGTAQGKTKRITRFVLRLLNTLGLKYGPDANTLDEYDFNQGATYNEDLALFSGDTQSLPWPQGYEQDGTIYLENDGVFPATILAVMPQLVTQDR